MTPGQKSHNDVARLERFILGWQIEGGQYLRENPTQDLKVRSLRTITQKYLRENAGYTGGDQVPHTASRCLLDLFDAVEAWAVEAGAKTPPFAVGSCMIDVIVRRLMVIRGSQSLKRG